MTKRALVLGGGGPVGIAWESGLVAGLAECGVDVSKAESFTGTSAGSVVGAQLAMGRSPQQMYAEVAADASRTAPSAARGNAGTGAPAPDLSGLMHFMQKAVTGELPPDEIRRQIGAFALAAKTITEEDFIATIGRMLASTEDWPHPGYQCTAVDALTGEFVTWKAQSNVPLSSAIASSCSVPGIYPPITINGRRYIDGGMRSSTNADLAAGNDLVVVVSVSMNVPGPRAELSKRRLANEFAAITDAGGQALLIEPDAASQEVFGLNLMDFSRRAGAAEAGLAQGRAEAKRVAEFWG